MTVGIIGAGAAGMAAALAASENPDVDVLLIERQNRVGRKLQATGNGRCNLSNLHALEGHYHGENAEFAKHALEAFNPEATLSWFADLGLYTVTEPSGKVYPYSDQANSVVDILRFALERPNIQLITGYDVSRIRRNATGFLIEGTGAPVECQKLIVACGGLAGTALGGSMSGYKLLRSFGHHVTKLRPNLVQIKSSWPGVKALKGVRANCYVKIYCDDKLWSESSGELQFTEFGISGPVIFEISRDVCAEKGEWKAVLDFLPDWTTERLCDELSRRCDRSILTDDILTGLLHNRLGRTLTQASGVRLGQPIGTVDREMVKQISCSVKMFDVDLTEPLGMDSAQVTAGGIYTSEFRPESMESRLVPGLYACGEVLDIDGDCGGYNLQWAWSSGHLAGIQAAKK